MCCRNSALANWRRGSLIRAMSEPVVLLFSGQGAQSVGMGRDLYEGHEEIKALFDSGNEALGWNLTDVMFEGPIDELTRTSNCQPALFAHGIACLHLLRARMPDLQIAATAGLSLGEFTAYTAAGALDFQDGLKLVAKRGALMDEACAATEGTMAAMIGGDESAVRALAAEADVDVANLNAPGQIVLSGSKEGIASAMEKYKDHGIRLAKALTVAGAYHSRLMQSAREALETELAATNFSETQFPVYSNVHAGPVAPETVRQSLAEQVTGSVRWSESIQSLTASGHKLFIELGPGGILAGLMKRIDKSARVVSIHDQETLNTAMEELGGA